MKEQPQPSSVERALREIINPSLVKAEADFREIALQLVHLDPLALPPYLDLFIHHQLQTSIEHVPGSQIISTVHTDMVLGGPPWIGHHFEIATLPPHCFWILIFPEIFPDGSTKLSLGMLKRDGRRLYTAWADSHYPLSAQSRHQEHSPYLVLVQHIHPSLHADLTEMNELADKQLQIDKRYGAMYLFTPSTPLQERRRPPTLKDSLKRLQSLKSRQPLFKPSFPSK